MLWLMGLAVVCARLLAFPLLPVDETRYLSVAWEMHQSSNWLVPHINGEPYPQKPPLMFWLLNIGWLLGIGSDFLSRLVVPMAGLMNVLALRALIVSVAPRQQQLAALAPGCCWGLSPGRYSWR
ncbi:ArnT family glycosyltransferase [Gallaecimonas pentaromativorans]|uniref:ArnT family glycosyltransferase n=1 Tax=Gallaecimonas pentaromativorans TaxID=584787 RepID=UPI003A8E4719